MPDMPGEAESPETRLKRLHLRSMRRGIREMDLLLSAFVASELAGLKEKDLVLYDRILDENDQDLYAWVTGRTEAPERYAELIPRIASALQRN